MPTAADYAAGPRDAMVRRLDRQYARHDPHESLRAFQRRREEVMTLLRGLSVAEWQRVGIHLGRGRLPLAEWVASLAGHDDNHVAQLERALAGQP